MFLCAAAAAIEEFIEPGTKKEKVSNLFYLYDCNFKENQIEHHTIVKMDSQVKFQYK